MECHLTPWLQVMLPVPMYLHTHPATGSSCPVTSEQQTEARSNAVYKKKKKSGFIVFQSVKVNEERLKKKKKQCQCRRARRHSAQVQMVSKAECWRKRRIHMERLISEVKISYRQQHCDNTQVSGSANFGTLL